MYHVKLTSTAALMFRSLHPKIRKQIKSVLKELYDNPYLGKKLKDELRYFRSIRMKRYRAVYIVNDVKKSVIVVAIGLRANIYDIVADLSE